VGSVFSYTVCFQEATSGISSLREGDSKQMTGGNRDRWVDAVPGTSKTNQTVSEHRQEINGSDFSMIGNVLVVDGTFPGLWLPWCETAFTLMCC